MNMLKLTAMAVFRLQSFTSVILFPSGKVIWAYDVSECGKGVMKN